MGSVNKVILIGNLGRDPEVRASRTGQPVANFSIATSEGWTGKDGQRQEKTEWHRVVAYDKLAELARDYLARGRSVYVEGRLQTRKWQDKAGNERQTTEVIARQIVFLGNGGGEGRRSGGGNARPPELYQQQEQQPDQGGYDDDIPF